MSGEKGGKDLPSFAGFCSKNISYKIIKHDEEKKNWLSSLKKVASNLTNIEKKKKYRQFGL